MEFNLKIYKQFQIMILYTQICVLGPPLGPEKYKHC